MGRPLKDFHRDSGNRLLSSLIFFFCFFVLGIAVWTAVRGVDILLGRLAFITVYTLHAAIAYTLGRWLAEAALSQGRPAWAAYQNRTVGRQWAVWLGGFFLGLIIHRTLVKGAVSYYAKTMNWYPAFHTSHSLPSQARSLDNYFALAGLSVWLVASCLVFIWVMRRQGRMAERSQPAAPGLDSGHPLPVGHPPGILRIKADGRPLAIPHAHISHISVEDHYLRIFHRQDGSTRDVLIRQSLKDLLKQLPGQHFMQIHRSHVVNLGQVAGIEQNGKEKHLNLRSHDKPLPISRHRLPALRPRLEKALSEQAGRPGAFQGAHPQGR